MGIQQRWCELMTELCIRLLCFFVSPMSCHSLHVHDRRLAGEAAAHQDIGHVRRVAVAVRGFNVCCTAGVATQCSCVCPHELSSCSRRPCYMSMNMCAPCQLTRVSIEYTARLVNMIDAPDPIFLCISS